MACIVDDDSPAQLPLQVLFLSPDLLGCLISPLGRIEPYGERVPVGKKVSESGLVRYRYRSRYYDSEE